MQHPPWGLSMRRASNMANHSQTVAGSSFKSLITAHRIGYQTVGTQFGVKHSPYTTYGFNYPRKIEQKGLSTRISRLAIGMETEPAYDLAVLFRSDRRTLTGPAVGSRVNCLASFPLDCPDETVRPVARKPFGACHRQDVGVRPHKLTSIFTPELPSCGVFC